MGITFIGNPFDQETEYDDSDWEMNAVEEWILPPQEIAFINETARATIDVDLMPVEGESSDSYAEEESDEEYFPEEEEEDEEEDIDANFDIEDEVAEFRPYFYDLNDDDDDDDIDYVTYPIRTEQDSEPDKPTTSETSNQGESSDTD